jgi:hypothetical protein
MLSLLGDGLGYAFTEPHPIRITKIGTRGSDFQGSTIGTAHARGEAAAMHR